MNNSLSTNIWARLIALNLKKGHSPLKSTRRTRQAQNWLEDLSEIHWRYLGVENLKGGFGTMKYSDGRIYKGDWKDGKKEGNEVLTLSNGDKYKGNWMDDAIQPVLKINYADGEVYEGEINVENLHKQGKGVLIFENGDQYDGGWLTDKQHGKGKKTWKRDECTYEGVWEEGKIKGEGMMIYSDGTKFKAQWEKVEEVENKEEALEENKESQNQKNDPTE